MKEKDRLEDFLAESEEDDSPKVAKKGVARKRRGSVESTFKSTSLSGSPELKKPIQSPSLEWNNMDEISKLDKMFETSKKQPNDGGAR